MTNFVVDLDDFCESNTDWWMLEEIKKQLPHFKVNLFTIVGHCGRDFIEEMRGYDWVRLYPHGFLHKTSRECEKWSYQTSQDYLWELEIDKWPKLWKSPGWQSSQELLECLNDRGWAIADQAYNNERRPEGLRHYLLDSPNKIHGHIGHWGAHNDNSLEFIFDQIVSLRGEFLFIEESL